MFTVVINSDYELTDLFVKSSENRLKELRDQIKIFVWCFYPTSIIKKEKQ